MLLLFALGYILEQKVVPLTALHSINNLVNRRGVSHYFFRVCQNEKLVCAGVL